MGKKYDLGIIGGGPGGYVAAIRAAQLGKKVLLVERDRIGGTCTNYGCIPTKHLLHQTKILREVRENKNLEGPLAEIKCNWKRVQREKNDVVNRLVKGIEFLLEKNEVDILSSEGVLEDKGRIAVESEGERKMFETEKIILATGSRASGLPFLMPNEEEVVTSRQALEFEDIPRKMLIIGAGAIGLEIGIIYHRLGTEVSILEIMPTILPGSDREMVTRLERILKSQGLKVYTQMKIETAEVGKGKVRLLGTCSKTRAPFEFEAEKVLLATGRRPESEILKGTGIGLDSHGFVQVSSQLETNISGIYAIGDLVGGKLLAHKASHEGVVAAENASGLKKEMNYKALPMAIFTEPEFSSVGLTEEEAREKMGKVQVGLFTLQANGRALTMGAQEGMVKIVADENDKIIGGHILAPHASELLPELVLAMNKGLKVQDIASCVHIHPTLSEVMMEAALKIEKRAIHMLNF